MKKPAEKETRAEASAERSRIRKAMSRWESMNAAGRLLGRGLPKSELFDRVALEVGATLRQVHDALRAIR